MPNQTDVHDTCCVALELSQSAWVCGLSPPEGGKICIQKIAAGDVRALLSFLDAQHVRAEREAGRSLSVVVCYEAGYDGFWLARLLIGRGIRTVVFDPVASSCRVAVGWQKPIASTPKV